MKKSQDNQVIIDWSCNRGYRKSNYNGTNENIPVDKGARNEIISKDTGTRK